MRPVLWALLVALPVFFGVGLLLSSGSLTCLNLQHTSVLWLLVVSPCLEEIVFRGLLQGELKQTRLGQQSWSQLTSANLLTSVLFAAAHTLSSGIAAASTFFPSLVLGWVKERSQRLWPCILVHGLYNFGFLAILQWCQSLL